MPNQKGLYLGVWQIGIKAKVIENQVMAISVILVSSDSLEDSVGTYIGRVILFSTIPTTILDTTPSVIPPTTHIDTTPIPTISPNIPSSPDYTPASPNYSPAPDTESLVASGALRRRVMVLAPGQPIPYVDYSSSDYFSLDDSLRDSSWSSSLETSSDSSAYVLSDSTSSRSSSDNSLPTPSSDMRPSHHLCSLVPSFPRSSAAISDRPSHDSSSVSPSCKRSRSPATSVLLSSHISRALSYVCADLLPSPKRIRSPESATDLEVCLAGGSELSRYRGIELKMDDDVVRSDGIDIDPEIQEEIDECIAYADALRDRGIDARVVVEEERAVEVTYETLRDLVQRIVVTGQQSADMLERIRELERDNRRLRDMIDVASQREEVNGNGGNGNGGNGNGRNGNRGNGNGGNGNGGNGNERGNGYNFGGFMPARECAYQDFLKCQPLSFNETEGVVGLTHWFEKMETMFHINNCPEKYQEDKVERFIGGSPDNIQGNVIAAKPTKLQDAIRIVNNLMDQKLKGYARSAENKRRLENNPRDNRGQQPVFKQQNVGGQNVARAYTAGNNEKKG
ncbi:hypothetical protein Tco_1333323, partial [Tanacetum coccineum]